MSIIDDVLRREGSPTADPLDNGGRTAFGISETSHPEAWADGIVTMDEARAIYEGKYIKGPKFDQLPPLLLHQMVDFGVNSGPQVAVKHLQEVLHCSVDGKLGPQTLTALASADVRAVNNALVVKRVLMLCKICVKTPSQLKFLVGWVNRACEFLQ